MTQYNGWNDAEWIEWWGLGPDDPYDPFEGPEEEPDYSEE